MRFLIILTFLTFFYSIGFGQVATIEVDLKEKLYKNKRQVYFSTSNDAKTIYGFMPLKNEEYYQLYIFNENFEVIKKLGKIDLGVFGDFRDVYVDEENIISVITNESETSELINAFKVTERSFSLYKTSMNIPNYSKSIDINLGSKEAIIGTHKKETIYYLITLNKDGLIQIYNVDIDEMKYTKKEVEGSYSSFYNYVNGSVSNAIGFVQIDNDKYYDLQTSSAILKSYFLDGEYVIESLGAGTNILTFINLETGKIRKKTFKNIEGYRSSIMHKDKYYVSEIGGKNVSFKIFDVESEKLLNTYLCNKSDKTIPFQSTKIIDNGFLIEKPKMFIKKLGKSSSPTKSYGLIPQSIDSLTIITFGMPYYNSSSSYVATGPTTGIQNVNYAKSEYKYQDIIPNYYDSMIMESWINPDGTIISYNEKNKFQSNYYKIINLINTYSSRSSFSKLSIFQFKNVWYFGVYDENNQKYLIFSVEAS